MTFSVASNPFVFSLKRPFPQGNSDAVKVSSNAESIHKRRRINEDEKITQAVGQVSLNHQTERVGRDWKSSFQELEDCFENEWESSLKNVENVVTQCQSPFYDYFDAHRSSYDCFYMDADLYAEAGLFTESQKEEGGVKEALSLGQHLTSQSLAESGDFRQEDKSIDTVYWKAAINHAQEGDYEQLNSVLDRAPSDLSPEAVEEIFDCVFAYDSSLLIKTVDLGLSDVCRGALLKYALEMNDQTLAKAAVNGKKGQTPLNFSKWCGNNTLLTVALQKELRNDAAMISYLLSLTSFDKDDFKEIGWRLCLSNLWALTGRFHFKGETFDREGALPFMCDSKVCKSIKAFKHEHPGVLRNQTLKLLREMIKGAEQKVSVEERLQRYKQDKPIMLLGGSKSHQLRVYLSAWLMFIGDRGLYSRQPVTVFTIAPEFVTAECLEKIVRSNEEFDDDEADAFFNKELPEILNGTRFNNMHMPLTEALSDNWIGPQELETGSCVTDSLCTFLAGAVAMDSWNRCGRGYETIPMELEKVNVLITYILFDVAKQYLEYSAKNPLNMDNELFPRILVEAKRKAVKADDYFQTKNNVRHFFHAKAQALEARYDELCKKANRCSRRLNMDAKKRGRSTNGRISTQSSQLQ